jgi:hypothetical protein
VNYLVKVYPMRLPKNIMLRTVLTAYFFFAGLCYSHLEAQWQTQPIPLKAGWNPIYLHVDATHASISDLVGDLAIDEIWLWSPSVNEAQFVLSPDAPSGSKSRWIEWRNNLGDATSQLKSLIPNAAYLVRLSDGASDTTWSLKGKPVPPQYNWTTTGLNFVGFPVNPSANWNLESYFLKAGSFLSSAEFYNYVSGDLGRNNPAKVFGLRTTALPRGRAMWVDTGDAFNQFYGPFQLVLQNYRGIQFGSKMNSTRFRLRNATTSPLTVIISSLQSEAPPADAPSEGDISSALMIRGELNNETQTYDYQECPCEGVTIELAPKGSPGQEVEVVVGLDRSQFDSPVGQVYSGLLRIEDALNQSRIDIPVQANHQSHEGLWVGDAQITGVSRANTETTEPVSQSYPLRFILHQEDVTVTSTSAGAAGDEVELTVSPVSKKLFPGEVFIFPNGSQITLTEETPLNGDKITGSIVGSDGISAASQGKMSRLRLLQRVYVGLLPGGVEGLSTHESLLDASHIEQANRISSIHLPFSPKNTPWTVSGKISPGAALLASVNVAFNNQAANPFLHTYHPDHDNLNADFTAELGQGIESYGIERSIQFLINNSAEGFNEKVSFGDTISGSYQETLKLTGSPGSGPENANSYTLSGDFKLVRISSISNLVQP